MKILKTTLICLAFNFGVNAQNYEWTKINAGTYNEEGRAIVTDVAGNIYTSGYFQGTVDFDPNTGSYPLTTNPTVLADIFIQKLDPNGNLIWVKQIGGNGTESTIGMTIDSNGDIIICGYFENTVDFDPGVNTANLSSTGSGRDIFVAKYDSNGNFIWAKSVSGASGDDIARQVFTDAAKNVYLTGEFEGTIDFDPGAGVSNLTSNGNTDVFVLKLDLNGNFVWAKSFGGTLWDVGHYITVDGAGNVFTVGNYRETVDFDTGAGTFSITSNGINDIFIHKLDNAGNFLWAKSMGSTSSDFAYGVVVDDADNVYTAGYYYNTVDFDPNAGTYNLTSQGSYDVFVQKLDNNGNLIWAKSMGGSSDDYCWGLAIDNSNNLYTTGYFYGTSDFDPGTGTFNITAVGVEDIFVQKLDENGNFVWAKSFGGGDFDAGKAIYVDNSGNVYTTGYFQQTVDFDPSTGTDVFTSLGLYDCFIQKLSPPCTNTTGTDIITACDSYTWIDGVTYTSNNTTAQHTIVGGASNGCDSIVTLNLTINTVDVSVTTTDPSISANTNTANSYQWLDCDNNYAVISGANAQTFTANANGNYAVEITENGCTDTSNCVTISTVGYNQLDNNSDIKVFPNPFNNKLIVNLGNETLTNPILKIIDLSGRVVYSEMYNNQNSIEIDLTNQPSGMYFLMIETSNSLSYVKIIKE